MILMTNDFVQKELLQWYRQNARKLPWRRAKDAYATWISEVMLQQTQVEKVIPYYEKWMRRFPDVQSLACTTTEEILKEWEGLGYYSRARNIHRAAGIIVKEHDGKIPKSAAELQKLPGIGEYMAGAIASIVFGKTEPALDGNGMRVLSRLLDYQEPVNTSAGKNHLTSRLREMLPENDAGLFNQALMDLGSMVCLPREWKCEACPLSPVCLARQAGNQQSRPVKIRKKTSPHYQVVAAVIQEGKWVLIDKRKASGLLGGLWEFPGGKLDEGETLEQAVVREIREELGVEVRVGKKLGEYAHAYTHFRVNVHAFFTNILDGKPRALESERIEWVEIADLKEYPMGKVDRRISNDLLKTIS